jgi:hypothetical protein
MLPAIPPGANVVYSKPDDWDEEKNGPCADLHVIKDDNGFITSMWKPEPAELEALNAGGYVMLVIAQQELPPLSLGVVSADFDQNQMSSSLPA